MRLLERLPPRPAPRVVARWVVVVLTVRALLLSAYFTLGDLKDGERGTAGIILVEEFSALATALPLLLVIVWGALRWPLVHRRWRQHLAPQLALFALFSGVHTVAMELLRAVTLPLVGGANPLGARDLAFAIAHEMPNDLYTFALCLTAIELWFYWWRQDERTRREAELRRALAEAQLTALRLQLQPHFLFNALNTVSATMYDDPRRADAMLGALADLLRASLRAGSGDEVPLREEVATAAAYVRLQHERFGDRLTVTFDIPAECDAVRVPAFLLQPLLENAVRHGDVERTGHGAIRVTARVEEARLVLEVWDDGSGAPSAPGGGLGLRATAERLRLLHGEAGELAAGPVADGWRVRLRLPARTVA